MAHSVAWRWVRYRVQVLLCLVAVGASGLAPAQDATWWWCWMSEGVWVVRSCPGRLPWPAANRQPRSYTPGRRPRAAAVKLLPPACTVTGTNPAWTTRRLRLDAAAPVGDGVARECRPRADRLTASVAPSPDEEKRWGSRPASLSRIAVLVGRRRRLFVRQQDHHVAVAVHHHLQVV